MKISMLNRPLLLLTGLLAAYQVSVGIDGFSTVPVIAYTLSFGVLLVAGLLLILLGMEVLDSPLVVIVSSIIPLSLSLGLVWQRLPSLRLAYLVFVVLAFLGIMVTRAFPAPVKLASLVLALSHGISGLVIFLLPVILAWQGVMKPAFSLVGVGGALIGLGGMLLAFLKAGKPLLSKETIFSVLPLILFLMTLFFVAGFRYA
jgi:hypothetical protein